MVTKLNGHADDGTTNDNQAQPSTNDGFDTQLAAWPIRIVVVFSAVLYFV